MSNQEEYSLTMFKESLKSKESVKAYTWYVKKFMKFHSIESFDLIDDWNKFTSDN